MSPFRWGGPQSLRPKNLGLTLSRSQACIGNKSIASEAIAPYRKDVLAKCYGGDISRKKKLLQKQADGKKRMKQLGKVEVPQSAFMAVLNLNKEGEGSDD